MLTLKSMMDSKSAMSDADRFLYAELGAILERGFGGNVEFFAVVLLEKVKASPNRYDELCATLAGRVFVLGNTFWGHVFLSYRVFIFGEDANAVNCLATIGSTYKQFQSGC